MRPEPGDLDKLKSWTSDRWGSWLLSGLTHWFGTEQTRHAFKPLHTFVGAGPTLAEDLAAIHSACPPYLALEFRFGIGTAIGHAQDARILDVLVAIAHRVEAWESVSALSGRIVREASLLTARDGLLDRVLFAIAALSVNAGSGRHTREAIDAIRAIVETAAFPVEYAGPVLVTLARIAPDQLSDHLLLLRPRLDSLFSSVTPDLNGWEAEEFEKGARRHELVRLVHEQVGTRNLMNSLLLPTQRDSMGLDWWQSTVATFLRPKNMSNGIELEPFGAAPIVVTVNDNATFARRTVRGSVRAFDTQATPVNMLATLFPNLETCG